MLGTDVDDRLQSCDILKITPDEIDGNFLRLHIVNRNIHTTRPPIKKHPHRIHSTIRKRRFHTTISPKSPVNPRQLRKEGGLLEGDV